MKSIIHIHVNSLIVALLLSTAAIASDPEYTNIDTGYTAHTPMEKPDPAYTKRYNEEIDRVKTAKPDYKELTNMWMSVVKRTVILNLKSRYGSAVLTEAQIDAVAQVDTIEYRKSLSDEQFKLQLDELHHQATNTAIQQLEYERDFPHYADRPKPASAQPSEPKPSNFETIFFQWLGNRIQSNLEGASQESGEGARALRAGIGISVRDIQSDGLLGGENSYLRKIVPTWSDGGGFLGGENSFFRKNLGLPW